MVLIDKNKVYGIILGHALGDALGTPVEFFPYAHYNGKLETPIIRYSRTYGKQVGVVGQVSDDTEMAMILLKTIGDGYTKERAVVNYMTWANNKFDGCKGRSPFMGRNTRNLFIAPKSNYELYLNRFRKHYPDFETMEASQSNGALMRAYAHIFAEDENIIREDVFITNPSELVYNAVYTYIQAIKMAIENTPKHIIMVKIRDMIKFDKLLIAFDEASRNTFRNVTINKGHIINAYYCAFWGLFQFDNYKDAIDAIISLGPEEGIPAMICVRGKWKKSEVIIGDTDTNAAIAGALLGAYYGYDKIVENNITRENMDILLNCDSALGDIVRPPDYKLTEEFIADFVKN